MSTNPVLLLHGWGGSCAATYERNGWLAQLSQTGRQILLIDLPGHGPRGGSHDPSAYSDLAGELGRLLPDVQLDVIAYSLGGKVALELASRRPDRFGRLVIGGVGDNIFLPEEHGAALADALELGLSPDAPDPVRALVEYSRASQSDPLALAAVLRRAPNPVADEARLSRIEGQIMLVNGSTDTFVQPDTRLRAALREHVYVPLTNVDHFALPRNVTFMTNAIKFVSGGVTDISDNQEQIAAMQ
ncbi:alpha/beta fold hydrolase [Sphingobium sp. H39-3-25]|uniref:alpha/beta fold hydrolase n=1 Tax=Sphingomonadales TaxID=204457 RepID=UPI00082A6F5E|nr:alpha/beta fold hydrolase [Novosphingobium naphthalenivorans]MDF0546643.1 alpha/beta fold hydrolase [Sphingobium arseniciresistens]